MAMDLDHVRGAKVRNVSALVSGAYRLELIAAELKKCDVVCACCHRVRTAKRGANRAPSIKSLRRRRTGEKRSGRWLPVRGTSRAAKRASVRLTVLR